MKGFRSRLPLLLAAVPLAVALLLAGPAAVAASGGVDASAAAAGDVTVTPFAGEVQVPAGSTMTGSVQMVAGEVRVDGTLQGAVSMAVGQVSVGPQGVITGSLTLGVGQLTVQPGGRVEGPITVAGTSMPPLQCPSDQATACTMWSLDRAAAVRTLKCPSGQATACTVVSGGQSSTGSGPRISGVVVPPVWHTGIQRLFSWPHWWRTAFQTVRWLGMLALAIPVAALFPRALGRVVAQVEGEPGRTALIGLAVAVLALPALVLVAITIIGIPVALAAALGLGVAWFFGYVGVVLLVGRQTLRLGGLTLPNPLLAVVVGATLVALAEWVPILGGLVGLAVAFLGIGAVLLTRFGTGSRWPGGRPADPAPPAAP